MVILGALSWSFGNVIVKKASPDNMLAFIAWSSLFSPIPLLFIWMVTSDYFDIGSAIYNIDFLGIFSIAFQVYVTTLFGYWVWNNLIKRYPISTVAPISLLVPVFGLLGSVIIFGESITHIKALSSVLILLGLALFVFSNRFVKE